VDFDSTVRALRDTPIFALTSQSRKLRRGMPDRVDFVPALSREMKIYVTALMIVKNVPLFGWATFSVCLYHKHFRILYMCRRDHNCGAADQKIGARMCWRTGSWHSLLIGNS